MHKEIGKTLESLWNLRFSNQIEECERQLCTLLNRSLQITEIRPDQTPWVLSTFVKMGATEKNVADILSLYTSILRRRNEVGLAQEVLSALQPMLSKSYFHPTFQRGLNHFHRDEIDLAFEHFVRTRKLAETPFHSLAATFNLMACAEDLGVLVDGGEFQKEFEKLSPTERQILNEQYLGYCARGCFRKHKLEELVHVCQEPELSGQSLYYVCYLLELPYLNLKEKVNGAERLREKLLLQSQEQYQMRFSINTLLGFLEGENDKETRSSLISERLYLWTWRWIVKPDENLLEKIKCFLKKVHLESRRRSLDDQIQISLALRWLRLFGVPLSAGLKKMILSTKNIDSTLFQTYFFESQTIDQIENKEAVKLKGYFENPLIKGLLRPMQIESLESTRIRVSWQNFTIQVPGNQMIQDEVLTKFICLYFERPLVPSTLVANEILEIKEFDEFVHGNRLAKFILKINRDLKSFLKVSKKGNYLYLKGNWDLIDISEPWKHYKVVQNVFRPQEKLEISTPFLSDEVSVTDMFSRTQLQIMLGVGKTQSTVLIKHWLNEGKIEVSGKGKKTLYKILDKDFFSSFLLARRL